MRRTFYAVINRTETVSPVKYIVDGKSRVIYRLWFDSIGRQINFGDMERMNNRVSKKIRKLLTKDTKESFNSFAEAINGCDFKARVKIAIKVLLGKL